MSETRHHRFEVGHFFYVIPVLLGIYTTGFAMLRPELLRALWFEVYAGACLLLQIAFVVRPCWRALCRSLGIRKAKTTC